MASEPLPFREFARIRSNRAARPRRVLPLRSLRLSPHPGRRGTITKQNGQEVEGG